MFSPPAQVVFPALAVTEVLLFLVAPPAQVVLQALEVTAVSLFIVFPPLPKWVSLPSELPTCRYLLGSRPCLGGVPRPRSHQNVAIHRVPALAQMRSLSCQLILFGVHVGIMYSFQWF